uniref:Cellular tumor antigen p53,Protein Mdm4 n=2 Tax=Homo sapiens TaxID=9606 RepID=UPI001BFEEC14|nr:Chain A, Cellular tumor antigen p53,Protein Mdm4 [Homo sapiens]
GSSHHHHHHSQDLENLYFQGSWKLLPENGSGSSENSGFSGSQINQVRPKLPLLKILHAAGAQGEMFTVKEVMHYLGQYIMVKQLYDQQEQHMVYCGGDLLGELLGRQSFSVKDPSPLYDMLRKNLVTLAT